MAPLFKTAPPTIIHHKNLLTTSQVFQVKEASKFKSVSNINKGIKPPYPLISLTIGQKLLPKKAPQELLPEKAPLESCIIGFSSPTPK